MKENYQEIRKLLTPRLSKYVPWIPHPKQQAFLLLDCEEAFIGGAAGPGKSVALLMAALQYVDVPGYNAILFRDSYANLSMPEGLISLAHDWLQNTDARWTDGTHYLFPSGATLRFGYLSGPMDHFHHQSAAYQFVGIDEIVQIRENQALYMFSRLRKKMPKSYRNAMKQIKGWTDEEADKYYKLYASIPLRFRCASNPPTREQIKTGAWVKTRYVNPTTRHKDVVFIPAWMEDNPSLDAEEYKKRSLSKLDPITRAQLEKGDWEIRVSGRMFKREWFAGKIKDTFPVENIRWIRFWDLAGTDPEEKKTKSDEPAYTAGVLIGLTTQGQIFIKDVRRDRLSPMNCEKLIRATAERDTRRVEIGMWQDPGQAGKSQISHYTRNILKGFTFRGRPATKAKEVVWSPLASQAEAGNVYLVEADWNEDFLNELELLPDGFKDQADAAGGGYEVLAGINTGATASINLITPKSNEYVSPEEFEKIKSKLKPGEQVIPVYEGDEIVDYEILRSGRGRRGIYIPGR